MSRSLAFCLLAAAMVAPSAAGQPQATSAQPAANALETAIANPARSAANRARDQYRHPAATLTFFGVKPSDTVVEIWPSSGWYTEILAPYLASGGGTLILASPEWNRGGITKLKAANATLYGPLTVTDFPMFDGKPAEIAPGTADVVLTFRNVHNWLTGYHRDDKADYSVAAFQQIYDMLKPGGVLGVVDHRLPESTGEIPGTDGYIKTSTVVRLAEQAGFKLAGTSEINANPKDTADWPNGVWTLPPSFALKDQDRAKYAAIGESDRMTLKFVKPATAPAQPERGR